MISSLRRTDAFTLVEVTLGLGVAAFCLVAVFGLVPVGVQTNRNAISQTAATNILSSVVSDIRGSQPGQNPSSIYKISRSKGFACTLCFDSQGKPTTSPTPIPGLQESACPANSIYRLFVQIAKNPNITAPGYPNYAYLKVSWPALANPRATPAINPSGSVGIVASYPLFP